MAVNRHFRKANGEKNKETTFIDCEAWDSGAETISKYVSKGDPFLVKGALKNDSWENKEGQKITKIKLRVEDFNLLSRRSTAPVEPTEDAPINTPEPIAEPNNGDDIPF